MDFGSIAGLVISFGLILLGNKLEGGHINSLILPTAMMMVMGGTVGAVVLQFPVKRVLSSVKGTIKIFFNKKSDIIGVINQVVLFSKSARREGILALEKEIENVKDPFLAQALQLAIDGLEPKILVETMENQMGVLDEDADFHVKVWEAAGGYAPTIGILAAVLGLIHVMSNLNDPSKLGGGIATAFVGTIYGVGLANLICLPFSSKIKFNAKRESLLREIELKGVLLIQEGVNHSIIEDQLKSYLEASEKSKYDTRFAKRD